MTKSACFVTTKRQGQVDDSRTVASDMQTIENECGVLELGPSKMYTEENGAGAEWDVAVARSAEPVCSDALCSLSRT